MAALTSIPSGGAAHPASSSTSTRSGRQQRAVTTGSHWSTAGSAYHEHDDEEDDRLPNLPESIPVLSLIPPRPQSKKPPSSLSRARSPSTHSSARPLSPRLHSHSASYANLTRTSTINTIPTPIAGVMSTRYQGLPPPTALGPNAPGYISIFSSRYAGNPRDGDDSDDSGEEGARYTLVENDRRGGLPTGGVGMGNEGLKKPGWGGKIRGKIGHIGRK
jgi:hypothetical protein